MVSNAKISLLGSFLLFTLDCIAVINLAVFALASLVFWQTGKDVINLHLVWRYGHAHMARIAKKCAMLISICFQVTDAVVSGEARLGNHLVNNPVEFLPRVEIVVRLKHSRNMVPHKQLVNRCIPSRTMLFEAIAAALIFTSPLVKRRHFNPTSRGLIPGEKIMYENKFESSMTALKRLFKPPILHLAQ